MTVRPDAQSQTRVQAPIAVIGMSGRFPGAADVESFWSALLEGRDMVRSSSVAEQVAAGVPHDTAHHPAFVPVTSFLEDHDALDAPLFGLTQRTAQEQDPQHRLLLEASRTALEDAGYDPRRYLGDVGVFVGSGSNDYATKVLTLDPATVANMGDMGIGIANEPDFAATFTSYHLGLRGPSLTVQTACSTSLVALHVACASLRAGDCDIALAGAAHLTVPHGHGYLYRDGGVLAPDGRCRPFDSGARGTIWGSGVGVVVLKRLPDALADRDEIDAVILGSAVNNDGDGKHSYTAPSSQGQARVLRRALAAAGVGPEQVRCLEAHGTATALGDPVEMAALHEVYGGGDQPCLVGSVKSNIGHLSGAAGMAGLIKTVRSLREGVVPPTLYETVNPALGLEGSRFRLPRQSQEWPSGPGPRLAGVSAFGIGGTNAHVIVAEPPAVPARVPESAFHLLPLSARTASALQRQVEELATHLLRHPKLDLGDVAYTLQEGRTRYEHRAIVVADSLPDAADALLDGGRIQRGPPGQPGGPPPVAFLFPGQGTQHAGMARGAYEHDVAYRTALDLCASVLDTHLGLDLRSLLHPPDGGAAQADEELRRTAVTQPALFSVEYALACMWRSWGVEPSAMLGHSVGEYVAACLAGVLRVEDALGLVAARGRLMGSLPEGSMLAVLLPEDELVARLPADLDLAAVNGPRACVMSGPTSSVRALAAVLEGEGHLVRELRTSHAFHSAMVDPVVEEFVAGVAQVPLQVPSIPYLSNVTGRWITAEEATDPEYYGRHLRGAVRFGSGLAQLTEESGWTLLEVGPGRTLADLARAQLRPGYDAPLATLPPAPAAGVDEDRKTSLTALATLWLRGAEIDWLTVGGPERGRTSLPTYPYERQRCWVAPRPAAAGKTIDAPPSPRPAAAAEERAIERWCEVPGWRTAPIAQRSGGAHGQRVLLFEDPGGGAGLSARLRDAGASVVSVRRGEAFGQDSGASFTVDPARREDYTAVLDALATAGLTPSRVVVAWGLGVGPSSGERLGGGEVLEHQEQAFFHLLALGQALAERRQPVALDVVTAQAQDVIGGDLLNPGLALVTGVCRVLPAEAPLLTCRQVDTDLPPGADDRATALDRLVTELASGQATPAVALRQGRRWVPEWTSVPLEDQGAAVPAWRRGGTYVITGGLGGIGLSVAEHLARTAMARLVLVSRRALPAVPARAAWLREHGADDPTSRALLAISRMEAAGAEVAVCSGDVTDAVSMAVVREAAMSRFGQVHGLVHAAGLPGGGMIEVKERAAAEAVLAPKVIGTVNLLDTFDGDGLEVVVLCSSVTSIVGGVGRVDYCAANAFLDAVSRSPRSSPSDTRIVSVSWGEWLDVGMAAAEHRATQPVSRPREPGASATNVGSPVEHPWLTSAHIRSDGAAVVRGRLDADRDWVVAEHRVGGTRLLPGTGYLELFRAAFEHAVSKAQPEQILELRDVHYIAPMVFTREGERYIEIAISATGNSLRELVVRSRGADREVMVEHAWARARWTIPPPAARRDLAGTAARCTMGSLAVSGMQERAAGGSVALGDRWTSLRRIRTGGTVQVGELVAAPLVAEDLPALPLHPALLDEAISFATVPEDGGQYLPVGMSRVLIRKPFAQQIYALVDHRGPVGQPVPDGGAAAPVCMWDVVVVDPDGEPLVEVDEVRLRRFETSGLETSDGLGAPGRAGMPPTEACEALRRLVATDSGPHAVLSAVPLSSMLGGELPRPVAQPSLAGEDSDPPEDDVRSTLLALWEDCLGHSGVGLQDDFFAAGGNSLVAVQLVWKVSDALGQQLSMRSLFDNPTIEGMARIIEAARAQPPGDVPEVLEGGLDAGPRTIAVLPRSSQ